MEAEVISIISHGYELSIYGYSHCFRKLQNSEVNVRSYMHLGSYENPRSRWKNPNLTYVSQMTIFLSSTSQNRRDWKIIVKNNSPDSTYHIIWFETGLRNIQRRCKAQGERMPQLGAIDTLNRDRCSSEEQNSLRSACRRIPTEAFFRIS